jgi:hypothetical protein
MPTSAESDPDPDERRLLAYARDLADAIDAVLPSWVERSVAQVLADAGRPADASVQAAAAEAGLRARSEVGGRVRALLVLDIDEQRTGPLAILRGAVTYPTGVLRGAGVAPVTRDATATRLFPDDLYDLSPAAFADVDPALHEPGMAWGAAKAFVHNKRRRAEGRR